MFSRWMAFNGVSLGIITSGRFSLRVTSAARLTRLSARPFETAATVVILHGTITIPRVANVPLAIGAFSSPIGWLLIEPKSDHRSRANPKDSFISSTQTKRPAAEIIVTTGTLLNKRILITASAIEAPLAPVMPTTIGELVFTNLLDVFNIHTSVEILILR